jgi:N-acetylglucosaminyl-diphospho-decaprenol L-rhamnosyltransferase
VPPTYDQRVTPTPEVTVVVPHYGEATAAVSLVQQLQRQGDHILEILVVDDASPIPFPDLSGVTVLRRATNGGFGAAVNTAAAVARGSLLMILNSDLVVPDNFVKDWITHAAPWQPAVTGPAVRTPAGNPEWTGRRDPSVTQQFTEWLTPLARWRHKDALHWLVGRDPRCQPGVTQPVDWLSGAALLIPTDAFRAAGGFDEDFFMFCEETDLQVRLRKVGLPAVFLGKVEVEHVGGGSTDPGHRREWLVAARMREAHLHGKERRLRSSLAVASGINLVWNAGRSALGRSTQPLATFRNELNLVRIPRRQGRDVP